jgi:hypothetical protein
VRRSLTWALAALILGAGGLVASGAEAGVNGRQHYQRDRIRAGIQDGSLTRPEVYRLGRSQLYTERLERRMRADDGRLGPCERPRLDRRLDRSSARIWRQRHDGQSR